jgi:hypothetical protein
MGPWEVTLAESPLAEIGRCGETLAVGLLASAVLQGSTLMERASAERAVGGGVNLSGSGG